MENTLFTPDKDGRIIIPYIQDERNVMAVLLHENLAQVNLFKTVSELIILFYNS